MKIFLAIILFLSASLHFHRFPLFRGTSASLFAQEFEDDFSDEDDIDKADEEVEEDHQADESGEVEKQEEKQANDDDPFGEDEKQEQAEKEAEEKERLAEEKERARLEAEERKKQQEKIAASEARLRKMREEEEKRRKESEAARLRKIQEEERYRSYFYDKAKASKIERHLPPRTGFAWSFQIGFEPNVGNSVNEGFTFGNQIPFPTAQKYLNQRPNKGGAVIANAFQSSVNELNSLLPDDTADNRRPKVTNSSAGLSAIPIAVSGVWYQEIFLVRLGVHFTHTAIGFGGTNRFIFYSGDREIYLEHKMSMLRFSVPLSFAFRLLSSRKYGAYLGGGPTFFYGINFSTFDSNQVTTYPDPTAGTITVARKGGTENFVTEEDTFTGSTLGFHILFGLEAEIFRGFKVTVELFQSFGTSSRVDDKRIDARTESTPGTLENSRPDSIQLNFSGTQILFGVRRFL